MNEDAAQPSDDFVGDWLEARQTDSDLDPEVLNLIEKNYGDNGLNEAALLNALMAHSQRREETDGSN